MPGTKTWAHGATLDSQAGVQSCSAVAPRGTGLAILGLCTLFFALHVGMLADVTNYHGDERFYTDAAIRMVQTGDYVTPHYADGAPRLNKPGLCYWILAASYHCLGIGLFSSRLPFLLAGCALVWITWKIAHELLRDARAALLAALVFAGNYQTMSLSTRSTPDILMCLFTSVGLWGFARVLFGADARSRATGRWMGWIGTGLGAAAKGGLALIAIAFVTLFALARDRHRARDLFRPASVALAALLAVSGFASFVWTHGQSALSAYYADQVGSRLPGALYGAPARAAVYVLSTLQHFLPWSALIAIAFFGARRELLAYARRERAILGFCGGAYVALLAVFSCANLERGRYFAPVYPLLSILIAALLVEGSRSAPAARWISASTRALLAAFGVAGVVLALAAARLDTRPLLGGLAIALACAAILRSTRRARPEALLLGLGLVVAAGLAVATHLCRPVFQVSPVEAFVRAVGDGVPAPEVGCAGFPSSLTSQIRLLSGGRLEAVLLDPTDAADDPSRTLLVTATIAAQLEASGRTIERCGARSTQLGARDVLAILCSARPKAALAATFEPCFFVLGASAR